jgi:hypothetical protein
MQIAHLEYQLDETLPTQRVLRLRIGVEDVRIAMDRVAAKLRKDLAVPGFRAGKAPLFLIRKHHVGRVVAEAFEELKRGAMDQVLQLLKDEDKPFIPPEVVERDKVRLLYDQPLEFAIKYLIDPSGIGNRPEAKHDEFDPMSGVHQQTQRKLPTGVPAGPRVPVTPRGGYHPLHPGSANVT